MQNKANLKMDITPYWEGQSELFSKIRDAGGFQNYAGTINNMNDAFTSDKYVRCIDEGISGGGIRLPGSGIFYVLTEGIEKGLEGNKAISRGLEAAADSLSKANIYGIYSHEDCWAVGMVYSLLPYDIKSLFVNSEHFGECL